MLKDDKPSKAFYIVSLKCRKTKISVVLIRKDAVQLKKCLDICLVISLKSVY